MACEYCALNNGTSKRIGKGSMQISRNKDGKYFLECVTTSDYQEATYCFNCGTKLEPMK